MPDHSNNEHTWLLVMLDHCNNDCSFSWCWITLTTIVAYLDARSL